MISAAADLLEAVNAYLAAARMAALAVQAAESRDESNEHRPRWRLRRASSGSLSHGEAKDLAERARELATVANGRIALVWLLFGKTSAAGKTAATIGQMLTNIQRLLEAIPADAAGARGAFPAVGGMLEQFIDGADRASQRLGWRGWRWLRRRD